MKSRKTARKYTLKEVIKLARILTDAARLDNRMPTIVVADAVMTLGEKMVKDNESVESGRV